MQYIYLQKIAENITPDLLPADWQEFDLETFTKDKTLYDFQQQALENTIKTLWLYFADKAENKEEFYKIYKDFGVSEIESHLNYGGRADSKSLKILKDYYPLNNDKISFENFINRMSFWMATGSGKSLVIVKLIEILGKLIQNKSIPKKDLLFLTYRDDLIEQFKKHVDEFNKYNTSTKINLKNLKDYDEVKNDNKLDFYENEITVFYYRSDLISDQRSEKFIDYKDYCENGNWYLVLDEAHKGDREESKRQCYYSIISMNGFMFNFSATFTDIRDFVTCVYEINLATFIEKGYGKHIYISEENLNSLKSDDDFADIDKQKIFLKSLILLTLLHSKFKEIRNINKTLYHKPLMVSLVNTVNVEDADLKLVFTEIEKIGRGEIDNDLFKQTINLLKDELSNITYLFEEESLRIIASDIENISIENILNCVFNSESPGGIEVLKIPGNDQELIFKLRTTDKPFMLSKTGDIYALLRQHFPNYEINESVDNESEFKIINDNDSEINLLLGSRAFYEGWDSNRPNILMFVNIGGTDAKKFVLQSTGRGIRIEPYPNKRQRIIFTQKSQTEQSYFDKIKEYIQPLETLFVYGTKAAALRQILAALKEQKKQIEIGNEFILNEEVKSKTLLIPVCKDSDEFLIDKRDIRYTTSDDDFLVTQKYLNYIGDKIALLKFEKAFYKEEKEVQVLEKAFEGFNISKTKYFQIDNTRVLNKPEITLNRVFDFIKIKNREIDKFKTLEDEIIHFRKIKVDEEKKDEIINNIKKVLNYAEKQNVIIKTKADFQKHKDLDKYTKQIQDIEEKYKSESSYKDLSFKYLVNHYYLPVILSYNEKINYITHIIRVASEVSFINDLHEFIKQNKVIFKNYDWWMFSKIDQTIDKISFPYYNPSSNRILPFHPDFIFWLKKGNNYKILFIDPKGTVFTEYQHKVDGFVMLFEGNTFVFEDENETLNIEVKLLLKTNNINLISDPYKKYWFQNISELDLF